MEKFKITIEGLEQLQSEYRHLLDVVRPEVTHELVEARSLGDLSENADYDSARERQGKIETRILEIEAILNNYEIITKSKSTKIVQIGCFVTVKDLLIDEVDKYEIVGNIEADPLENRISFESPLAKAILGKKAKEVVTVETLKPYQIEIMSIE